MSKKLTSSEANDQTMEGSSLVGLGQDEAKRADVTSASATALHDLPTEVLQYIITKAIILEAKDLKLAKITWKRKADGAVNRLETVCSKWGCILKPDVFRNKVHRILEGFADIPIVLEKLDELQMSLRGMPVRIATTNDELYLYCSYRYEFINVYNRNNLRELKDVIQLTDLEVYPQTIAACSLSNSVYLLGIKDTTSSVFRITRDDEQQFHISPWVEGLPEQNKFISISANGSIILSRTERPDELVSIYNPDGSLQRQMRLSLNLFRVSSIIPKSSGNLVLTTFNYELKRKLTEIDMDGNIVHQFQSSLLGYNVGCADSDDRILIVDQNSGIELLDSELNLLDVTLPEKLDNIWVYPHVLHYDRLRNEVLMIDYVGFFGTTSTLSMFRFKEER